MPAQFPARREFIAMIAITMMVVAFAIDTMLPALPQIAGELGARHPNDQQYVLTAFTVGMGIAQFFVGILSDSWGRRRLMIAALVVYTLSALAAAMAPTFGVLLAMRGVEGLCAGGVSVIAAAIVRDRYEGREMARINSLTSVVFMAAPIVAPSVGAAVLVFGDWRMIFVLLAVFGIVLVAWLGRRLPESLPVAARVPLQPGRVLDSARHVLADRASVGYTIALMLIQCTIFGYLASVQQIFAALGNAAFLPIGFAIMAGGIAIGSLVNSRIVMKLGMRRIGHVALVAFGAMAGVHLLVALAGRETIVTFTVLQTLMMMAFPLAVGNFNALAMEHMGSVAGTASSLQRSFITVFGSVGGIVIGQQFDGTTVPLYASITIAAIVALLVIFYVERGRLFVETQRAVPAG